MTRTQPSVTWSVVASTLGGLLLGIIAWECNRATRQLEDIARTLAVAVQRVEDHDRRLQNLETLFLKPQER